MNAIAVASTGFRSNRSTSHARSQIGRTLASDRSHPVVVEIPRDQLYFWSPAWQTLERAAAAEIAAGEIAGFDSVEDALDWLHSEH